jgi:hypothetical protein
MISAEPGDLAALAQLALDGAGQSIAQIHLLEELAA